MAEHLPVKLGLSQRFPCSYLPDKEEQLLVILDPVCYSPAGFETLLAHGFRRSGDQIYRPHCPSCKACKSVRVLSHEFTPSRSQKRKLLAVEKRFRVEYNDMERPEYFSLYSKYISARHSDGSMFPPDKKQYHSFLYCHWLPITFIELWEEERLIAVAVTDTMPQSLSAIYTFFDPDYEKYGLGSVMIMEQIRFARDNNKPYLYLGYQIDDCIKMRYKQQFTPAEKLSGELWQPI